MKLRKGDTVQVLAGKDRGRQGKIIESRPRLGMVVVEGINLKKKHTRPRRAGEKGQIVEFPGAVQIARVALVCQSCKKAVRVGYRMLNDGKKERRCMRCDATITSNA